MSRIIRLGIDSVTQAELADDSVGTDEIIDGDVAMIDRSDMAQGTAVGRPRGAGTGVPSALDEDQLAAIKGLVTGEPNGFENRTDSTIVWSDAGPDRTLTLDVAVADYDVWLGGIKTNLSAVLTSQAPPTEGLHFFYLDSAAALQTTMVWTDALVLSEVLVGIVYWDQTNSQGRLYDERHGHLMSGTVHEYLHDAFGARWTSGLGLADILADENGSLATHAQCSIGSGSIADEDLQHAITARAAPASTRVYYRDGAAGDWRWDAATDYPLKVGGTPRAAWNEWTGAVWQQTEVGNGRYCITHVFATNDTGDDIAIVQGQADYLNLSQAQDGADVELAALNLAGLPSAEWVALGSLLWQSSNSYGNAVQSRLRSTSQGADYVDWRTRANSAAGLGDGAVVNTDGRMWITPVDGRHTAGVWNTNVGVNSNPIKRRTAAATTDAWLCSANLPTRTTALRGRMVTAVRMVYSVTTAPVDDVQIRMWRQTVPTDGSGMAAMGLVAGGSVGTNYDTNHDSAAKRGVDNGAGGINYHTSTATPTAPAYLAEGEGVFLYCFVDGDAGAAGVVDLYGFMIEYEETLVN